MVRVWGFSDHQREMGSVQGNLFCRNFYTSTLTALNALNVAYLAHCLGIQYCCTFASTM